MPPKAGSGFAAARAQLAASATKASASSSSKVQPAKRRSFDDELAEACKVAAVAPPRAATEMTMLAERVEVKLSADTEEWLRADDMLEQASEVMRHLFGCEVLVHVSLLWPVRPSLGVTLLRADVVRNADGIEEEPCLLKLGNTNAVRTDARRVSMCPFADFSPRLIAGPVVAEGESGDTLPLSAARYELPYGSWRLPESLGTLAESGALTTYAARVAKFLASGAPPGSAEETHAALALPARLWTVGGPLTRLAGTTTTVECRGDDGWAHRVLSAVCHELVQQLLPGLKDGRRAALASDVHQPLLKELTRLVGLKDGGPRAPDGKKTAWGTEPSWFDESLLCELACDDSCDGVAEAVKQLAALSTSTKLDSSSPLSWMNQWKVRVAPCHGDMHAAQILLDSRDGAWVVSGGGVGGGGSSVMGASALSAESLRPIQGTLFDDAACLCASIVVDAIGADGVSDDDANAVLAALLPLTGGDRLWCPRSGPVAASPLVRRLLKVVSSLMLEATRHAACGCGTPHQLTDLHPAHWLAPLMVHALRLCRAPELSEARKRLAWRVTARAARALAVELQTPVDATAYAPNAAGCEAALATLVQQLRQDGPVADTRLTLACCQPLALHADASTGESARLAYIDAEGALATTTGGRFGQEFDEILASFRYDDLAQAHFSAHVAPTAFDEISEYDSAFTAVSQLFGQLHPRLLKLKPRLGELAPLLFAQASAKAEQLTDAVLADLVDALKGEAESSVATACTMLRATVSSTKRWCVARHKGAPTSKAKLEATERLAAGVVDLAHNLAIAKSKQGHIIRSHCRVPRLDCGQRVVVLDRTRPGTTLWRDATVIHGGPMLCEIDAEGKVCTWGSRAEELTGVSPSQAKASADWVEALLSGMDDMLEHARTCARGVLGGEAGGRLFESVCMPWNTTGGRPMYIAPILIREATPQGCRSASAAAVVIEAGTHIHMLTAADASGGTGDCRTVEMPLEPLNHAPLSLPTAAFDLELSRYLHTLQIEHSTTCDAIGRHVIPQPVTLMAAAPPASSAASAEKQREGGPDVQWDSVVDAKSLVERINATYKSNVLLDDHAQRVPIAALVFAPPGHGKSTVISQLAAAAVALQAKAGVFGLVPVVVSAMRLAQQMRAQPLVFGTSWNYIEAYSSLVHGKASPRHAFLRQLLISRRCLVLIDGLDEGGTTNEGDSWSLRSIASHAHEDLVTQGHAVVATACSDDCVGIDVGNGTARSDDDGGGADARKLAMRTRWARLSIAPLSDDQQRAMIKYRLGADAPRMAQCFKLVDTLRPFSRAAVGCPLMLGAVVSAVVSGGAGTQPVPTALAELMDTAVNAMLSRVDPRDRASPPGMPLLHAQRALLEALAIVAHTSGRDHGEVSEDEIVAHLEGRAELQSAWQWMRQKLARGMLPLLRVRSAKPLAVCLAHPCLTEYLATLALCHGRWPMSMPKPWAWSEWWCRVARLGGEEPSLREPFGRALLAACKTQEVVMEHVSGDPPTAAEAILAMIRQAATTGSPLRLRAGARKDVISAAKAPDQHGPCPAGELRLTGFDLGSLPVPGFAVLISLCSAEPGICALSVGKNGLTATHARALVEGAARGGRSGIDRINVERNALGSEGGISLCTALLQGVGERITDLDLSRNEIGHEAAKAIADMVKTNQLKRLVLTSNPLFGGSASGEFGDDAQARTASRAPHQTVAATAPTTAAAAAQGLPSSDAQKEAVKTIAAAVGACKSLKELYLRAVGLDTTGGHALGEAVATNRTLMHLSLWKNHLGDKGGKALITGLRMNSTLTVLDVRSNQLGDDAGLAIASHLSTARGSRLAELHASDNELGSESGRAIAKAWCDNATLAMLDVRGNKLDAAAVKDLKAARTQAAKKRAARENSAPVELLADD